MIGRPRLPSGLSRTDRIPSIKECENCPHQNQCKGGEYCVDVPNYVGRRKRRGETRK